MLAMYQYQEYLIQLHEIDHLQFEYFAQFSGLGAIVAGAGLTKNFNDIYVNVDDYSIEIDNDILRIKDTTLGTGLTGGSGQIIQTTSDQSHVTCTVDACHVPVSRVPNLVT